MTLPDEILSKVEMSPVEDLILAILREDITSIPVQSRIERNQKLPFILVRNEGSWGDWQGDERFLDASLVSVHVFAQGLDAEEEAALLSEAVRVVLRDARNRSIPGRGHIVSLRMSDRPHRSPDWVTSVGPVQYADLPNDAERSESTYKVIIRRSATKPFAP